MSPMKLLRSEMTRLMLAGFLVGSAAVAVFPTAALADDAAVQVVSR